MRIIRTSIGACARKLGLLQFIDNLRFAWLRRKNRAANEAFIREHPDYPVPPDDLAYDAFGSVDWPTYHRGGPIAAERFAELLLPHLPDRALDICEWGCGPGRIIRHIADYLPGGSRISASDYNEQTIAWCRENLPGIQFQPNPLEPPLAFADGAFDAIYAPSVLTHLSEAMCRAWMTELTRVTKPGGVILVTTKGDDQKTRLMPAEQKQIEEGVPVFRGRIVEGKRMFDTILPAEWVKRELLDGLKLLYYEASAIADSGQDVFVARKP